MEKTYYLGNATVTIVAPVITEKERQKRLRDIESLVYHLLRKETVDQGGELNVWESRQGV